MAGTLISTDIYILEDSMSGYNGLSFDDWTDGAEPVISNYLEDNGALYYFNAEDIDNAAAWGGIANSTLVYLYLNPATIVPYLSTTAPAWDETKNGYYLAASPTHRCYGQIFKDSSGNWDQKTIVMSKGHGVTNVGLNLGIGANADRDIILASDAKIYWDESEDEIWSDVGIGTYKSQDGGADVLVFTYNGGATSGDFTIKKPISCWIDVTGAAVRTLGLKKSGGYEGITISDTVIWLNPGTYRITHSASATTTIYAVGVYGAPTVTSSEIVV